MANKLFKSTTTVASMTMVSRVLGFVRDVVLAMVFGAGPQFDAFAVAFKIPNFLRRLFGEGAFAQAFVPVLSDYRENQDPASVKAFVDRIAGTLALILLVVVLLAEVLAPFIIMVFAPGFIDDAIRFPYATHMIHITFPYLWLIAMTAFAGSVQNTHNRFALPAFTPVILNVAMILVAWFWAPIANIPIYTLAWGVMIGGIVQLLIQFPALSRLHLLPRLRFGWQDPGVRRVIKLMVPAFFGVSVAQISLLIDNFFASFLQAGSISWLYYSDRFAYLPLGVIGVALATVVLPTLSRQYNNNHNNNYSAILDWALRLALIIGVPSAVGLFVLAGPILTTLIHHGAFDTFDVLMTQKSLRAFSVGLPGFMLIKILASAFYSRQNIKTPVKIAAIAMGINLILNLALIFPLKHTGLALATSLAGLCNAGLLLILLVHRGIFIPQSGWKKLGLQIVVANGVMVLAVGFIAGPLTDWLAWGVFKRVWYLAMTILVGVVVYGLVLKLMGFKRSSLRPPEIVS